jgi:hypothetical protein
LQEDLSAEKNDLSLFSNSPNNNEPKANKSIKNKSRALAASFVSTVLKKVEV